MKKLRTGLALIIAIASAGCGPELLGGAQNGEVRTVATSDEGGSSALVPGGDSPSTASAGTTHAAADDGASHDRASADVDPSAAVIAGPIEGEIDFDAAAWLITEDGDAVPLTNGFVSGAFRIDGPDEVLIGRTDVEARRYVAVRVDFTRVTGVVESGLLVNGTPVIGPVTVDLGATGRISVERELEVTIGRRTTQSVVIDLNAHEWLAATVLPGPLVPGHSFAAAVAITLR